jgi:hypothetical protein
MLAVATVLAIALVPLLLPAARRARQEDVLTQCKDHLRALGTGLRAYAGDHHQALPLSHTLENPQLELVQCLSPQYLGDSKTFYCPAQQQPALSYSEQNLKAGNIGYFYYSASETPDDQRLSKFLLTGVSWPRELKTGMNAKTWVMSDAWFSGEPTAHAGYKKGVNYLMLDGAVGFVSESPRQAFH